MISQDQCTNGDSFNFTVQENQNKFSLPVFKIESIYLKLCIHDEFNFEKKL